MSLFVPQARADLNAIPLEIAEGGPDRPLAVVIPLAPIDAALRHGRKL